jgi:hypothetical protein
MPDDTPQPHDTTALVQAPGAASAASAAFGLPAGAGTLAASAVIAGVALTAYAVRVWHSRRSAGQAARTPALAADMQELADRLASDLDHRAARLERLIAAADSRLVDLKSHARSPGATAGPDRRPWTAPDPTFADVYALADAGLPPVEIARRTKRPTGQVELILNLRQGNVAM